MNRVPDNRAYREQVTRWTATLTGWSPEVIDVCQTRCDYDDGLVRFAVRCHLDAGHAGAHRGTTTVEFAGLVTHR